MHRTIVVHLSGIGDSISARGLEHMRRLVRIIGLLVAMLAFSGSGSFAHQSQKSAKSSLIETFKLVDVSLPASFKLTPPGRLEEFRCLVLGGVVERIYTPYEWDMVIDNSSEAVGERTEVKAQFDVGVAEFTDLRYFRDFMTVAWREERGSPDIMVELTIDTMDAHTRTIQFHNKQLVLKPTNRPFHPF
jgi:hypothetical protein